MDTGIKLKLVGCDGNVFSIIGRASKALRQAGREEDVKKFQEEITSGDYDHALQTCMKWFDVE